MADDFVLPAATTIRRVNFWGFYNDDNPPLSETMRIRFYAARSGNGLPDENQMLFEQSVLNPSRTWTGRFVGTGVIPHEYFFTIDLSSALQLDAGTRYWLEAVQIGAVSTRFRWEFSIAELNGQAVINNAGAPDWAGSFPQLEVDAAFQLSIVPEASSVSNLVLISVLVGCRRVRLHRGERR